MKPSKGTSKPVTRSTGNVSADTGMASRFFSELPSNVAEDYIETRYFEEAKCQTLFGELEEAKSDIRILDAGCGTGRIAIPLARKYPNVRILGIDYSQHMIDCAIKRRDILRIPEKSLEFAKRELLEFARDYTNKEKFQYVICHWCFHCVRSWHSALIACVNLTSESGKLVWLNEESSFYLALDELPDREGLYQVDRPEGWKAFWAEYHANRARLEPHAKASHRLGTPVRCREHLEEFLRLLGWSTWSSGKVEWEKPVSYDWIIDKCLEPRAFTNLQRIPEKNNNELIEQLRSKLNRSPLPKGSEIVTLKYIATRSLASSPTEQPHESKRQIEENIKECAKHIYHELVDLCYFADKDKEAFDVIKGCLSSFFAAFFKPENIPLLRQFWQWDRQLEVPSWVWIRLATKPTKDFRRFLVDHLWAHTSIDGLFDKPVLDAYFNSDVTFAGLVRSAKPESWHPVLIRIDKVSDFSVASADKARDDDIIELIVPRSFVTNYCEEPYEKADTAFDKKTWVSNSTSNRKTLFGEDTGEEQQRWKKNLKAFGRELDTVFGVSTYEREPELFVRILQAMRLFPGNCYYFFPVRNATGELVSSISFALSSPLNRKQTTFLSELVDYLLTVPSLVITLVKPGRQRRRKTNDLTKTRAALASPGTAPDS